MQHNGWCSIIISQHQSRLPICFYCQTSAGFPISVMNRNHTVIVIVYADLNTPIIL